jgi:hypothetical protein
MEIYMKNNKNLFSVIILTIIIVFGLTACYYTFERKELSTNGRLTITGLDDYEGQKIYAEEDYYNGRLCAWEHIEEQFFDGEFVNFSPYYSSITNGQVRLKVYYNYNRNNIYNIPNLSSKCNENLIRCFEA